MSSTGPRGRRRVRRAAILKARRGPRAAGPGLFNLSECVANFARFFLDVLLPGAERVVYLDADQLSCETSLQLYDSKPEAVVAGVPRAQAACYDAKDQRPGMFFCDNTDLRAFADASSLKTFNAGIVLIDLKQWRALEARRQVHRNDARPCEEEALAPRIEPAARVIGARPLRGA